MLALKVNVRRFLKIDLDLERLYIQILTEKNKLHPSNPVAREFLGKLPRRLLRKASKTLAREPEITGYKFVRSDLGCVLEIIRDSKTQAVHLELQTH